jgi:hypothetical protein
MKEKQRINYQNIVGLLKCAELVILLNYLLKILI